jgi:hypothetical protein
MAAGRGDAAGGVVTDLVGRQDGVVVDQPGVAGEDGFLGRVVIDRPVAGDLELGRGGRLGVGEPGEQAQGAEQGGKAADERHGA